MKSYLTLIIAAFAGLCFSSSLNAEKIPAQGAYDARVRTVQYNEQQVYRLNMAMRSAMQIIFSKNEDIENIALGDSVSWEVAPSGHLLFVKPRDTPSPTNLIVTTRTSANQIRSYHFKISAAAPSVSEHSGAVFAVRFSYPQQQGLLNNKLIKQRAKQKSLEIEAAAVSLALDAAITQGPRNLNYVLAGPHALAPSEISDNGISTVLRFPRASPIPTIYKILPGGSEALVNFDVRGEFVIIHEVTRQLRLRLGKSVVCIWNESGERPQVGDLSTGTVSPDVIRQREPR